jgi:hypothetical protein
MGLGTLSPGAKKGNPKVALKPVTFLDVATWPVGVQPGRRSTVGVGSAAGSVLGAGSLEVTTDGDEASFSATGSGVDADVSTRSTGVRPLAEGCPAAEGSSEAEAPAGALSPKAGSCTDPHVNTKKNATRSAPAMTAPLVGVDWRQTTG